MLNIDVYDKRQYGAAHGAGQKETALLDYLLDAGADRNAPNHAGMTLMDYC